MSIADDPLFRRYYQKRLLKDKSTQQIAQLKAAAAKTQDVKPRMEPKDRWLALFSEMEATALDDSKLGASLLALDQDYRKKLKALPRTADPKPYEDAARQLEQYLLAIMATRDHPLNALIEQFTALFGELYSRQSGMLETTKIAAATLEKAVENVRTFIEKMVALIVQRYPEIETHNKRETCRQTVQEALFPRIYTDLFAIYQRKHFYRDAEFTQKLYALQVIRSRDLGVADHLSLEDIVANANAAAAAKTASPLASPSGTVTRGTAPAALNGSASASSAATNGHATAGSDQSSPSSASAAAPVVGSLLTSSLASSSSSAAGGGPNGTASPREGASASDSPGAANKLRPKKDWRGDAVRKLTNNKAPPSSKTMSLPRSVNSYMPSLPSNGLFANRTGSTTGPSAGGNSTSGRTVVAVGPAAAGGGVGGGGIGAADLLSRSPRAAVIEHGLLSFSPGKPRSARQYHPESSSLHIHNLKLQKEREHSERQTFEKQQSAARAVSVVLKDGESSGGAVAVNRQVGFMANPLGWGALASRHKPDSADGGSGVLEESPDLAATGSSALLSASVPVFSLEHIPPHMGLGAGAAAGAARGASSSTSSLGGGLTATGSPMVGGITPNPTPIDSLMAQRFGPGTFSPSSHAFSGVPPPAAATATDASAASAAASGSSASATTGFAAASSSSSSSASSSSSGASAPVNIKRIGALPPPQFGTATASAAAAATASSSSLSGGGASSPHTTIAVGGAAPASGTAAAAVSAAVASASSASGSAPAPSSSSSSSSSSSPMPAPRPASGLTAALTQLGIAHKAPAVDPEATHPYRLAIDSLKKLSLQKTPREKLQCIVVMSEDICTCVDECYKRLAIARQEGSEKLCINADDLLSLFALLLIKSKLSHVISEANFIEDFVGEGLRMAMPGYFLATLQAAIELIGKIDRKSIATTADADAKTGRTSGSGSGSGSGASRSGSGSGATAAAGGRPLQHHSRRGSDASWETMSVSSQVSQTSQLSQILNEFT